jgi:hypothetical protein
MAGLDRGGALGASGFPLERAYAPAWAAIEGDRLVYEWIAETPDGGHDWPRDVDPRRMLDRFIRIRSGADVARFAGRYGVLGICEHGLPASHSPTPQPLPKSGTATWCYAIGFFDTPQWEPIERWFHFARQAETLVQIAAALHTAVMPSQDLWAGAFAGYATMPYTTEPWDHATHRFTLAECVNEWLALGNARPRFAWHAGDEAPAFELGGGTFATLALQLALAVAGQQALAICDGCQIPYTRERKPQTGRRNYCADCGPRMAARIRKRAQRHRVV